MGQRQAGCALCNATWGDYWEEVDGKRLFFCCEVCARQYETILVEAKRMTGWSSVDGLEMRGDYRGRECTVSKGSRSHRFMISFFDDGKVRTVLDLGVE